MNDRLVNKIIKDLGKYKDNPKAMPDQDLANLLHSIDYVFSTTPSVGKRVMADVIKFFGKKRCKKVFLLQTKV